MAVQALRVETVINKPADLGVAARLHPLPELIDKARGVNGVCGRLLARWRRRAPAADGMSSHGARVGPLVQGRRALPRGKDQSQDPWDTGCEWVD